MATKERIRILIVESLPQMSRRLEKLLNLIENVEIIDTVNNALVANDIIRDEKPEVALVDINLPDMNGINFTEIVRRDFPLTQVIILSQNKYGETVLQAMRTGASDFLTHDVDFEELNLAIQRAGEVSIAEKRRVHPQTSDENGKGPSLRAGGAGQGRGKIITVYGPKGGSGVTTLAINLAIALQSDEATVALVDGNMQFGDIGVMLNEIAKFSVIDLIPRINELDKKVIEDVMVLHKSSGLHLLAAPSRPELAEKVTGNNFAKILEMLREIFDFVVVNTSSYISDPCLAALDAGDIIVLLTTQEIAAIRGTRTFLDLWEMFGMDKNRLILTLNRYKKERAITPEKISERLNLPIPVTIMEDEDKVYRSTNLGIPFMLDHKDTSIEKNIRTIAGLILENLPKIEHEGRYRIFSLDAV